jgi:hypothetical protein
MDYQINPAVSLCSKINPADSLYNKIKQQDIVAVRHTFNLLVSELKCDGGNLCSVKQIVADCNVSLQLVGMEQEDASGHTLLHVALQQDSAVDIVRFLTNMSSAMLFIHNTEGHNALHYAVLLHDVYEKTYQTRLERANERYKKMHDGVIATFMLAENHKLAQKEARFCTHPLSRAVTAFTGLHSDQLHDILLQMHASKLSNTMLLGNLYNTTSFLAEQSAKLSATDHNLGSARCHKR